MCTISCMKGEPDESQQKLRRKVRTYMSFWRRRLPPSQTTRRYRWAGWLSALSLCALVSSGIVLDQITKKQSQDHLLVWAAPDDIRSYRGNLHSLIQWGDIETARTEGPFFALNLSYVRNPGAAWGSLADLDDRIRVPLFHAVTIFCVVFIIFYIYMTPLSHRLSRWALTLILSGALGNMIDRLYLHYVIDWIDVRWNIWGWYYAFPNFNVADILISLGAFFFMFDTFILEARKRSRLAQARSFRVDRLDADAA